MNARLNLFFAKNTSEADAPALTHYLSPNACFKRGFSWLFFTYHVLFNFAIGRFSDFRAGTQEMFQSDKR